MLYEPFKELLKLLSSQNELYSHIFIIPLVSGYLIFLRRKEIFSNIHYSILSGITLIIIGIILYFIATYQGVKLNPNDHLALIIFSVLILWLGCFVLIYGSQTFKAGAFPILFLLFMVPIPTYLVNKVIFLLQSASAEVSYAFIKLTGVPIYRDGFVFQLANVSVEVAEQCSGIRSSIALLITSLLAGHLALGSGWGKIILALSIFPITIVKNGLRITTLSLLGSYVDITYLTNSLLHKKGGILFFILGLMLLAPIYLLLNRMEKKQIERRPEGIV